MGLFKNLGLTPKPNKTYSVISELIIQAISCTGTDTKIINSKNQTN